MMNKKYAVWLPLVIGITMAVGMYLGYYMRDAMPRKNFFATEKQNTLQEIVSLIQNRYVDEVEIKTLTDTAIEAILSKLDPHSNYIPAENLQGIKDDLAGSFYGIGIEYNIFNDTVTIVNVLKDGPGFKAGLQIGDQIIKVNDSATSGKKINHDKLIKQLRGEKGSKVTVTVLSTGKNKVIEIVRGNVPLVSVDAAYMLNADVGYIRINRFSTITFKEFMTALEKLKKEGMKKMVLDLRGNGGGILEDAVQMADEFLSGDKLITYTEGSHYKRKEYRCKRPGMFEEGQLIVLTDEGTASASEVLCGALQDWDRATIIGRRTFGKGLVQDQYELQDGSALRLTIARYYTPVGRSIQRSYKNGEKAYYAEIAKRFEDGETLTADSIKMDTTKAYKTVKGKKVFGSGGIMPDYFIPMDSSFTTIEKIIEKGTINSSVVEYYINHRTAFAAYKTPAEFSQSYTVSTDLWNAFVNKAATDSFKINSFSKATQTTISKLLKANIARILWRADGYFQSYNKDDKGITKALELLK